MRAILFLFFIAGSIATQWLTSTGLLAQDFKLGSQLISRECPAAYSRWSQRQLKTIRSEQVVDLIKNAPPNSIEIGAAYRPICKNCIQMDRYKDLNDIAKSALQRDLGRVPTPDEIRERVKDNRPFAVQTSDAGILGNAHSLPIQTGAMSLVVSKNFPWFGPAATDSTILPVLKEYSRVLDPHGKIILLKDGSSKSGFEVFNRHMALAQSIGLKVEYVDGFDFYGIVLNK